MQQGEECGALDQEGEMGEEEELEHAGDESDVDAEASEEEGIEGEEAGEGSEEEVSDIQEEGEPGEEQEGGAVADAVPRKTRRCCALSCSVRSSMISSIITSIDRCSFIGMCQLITYSLSTIIGDC